MANRLATETSPYLLQHQDNPVQWHVWGDDAFDKARAENKPILLSIGYAACHWCHVMAHESFEDDETARIMNERFINVKVDREERPDVDHLYMNALHLMKRHGGWPMTMFLTPQGQPFFGGTYFPKEPHPQMPSFQEVLQHVQDAWVEVPDEITEVGFNIQKALDHMAHTEASSTTIDWAEMDASASRLVGRMDAQYGGMNGAPKFPQPMWWMFLWRSAVRKKKPHFQEAVFTTANNICNGGIYDHLAGGFSRYSTDEMWLAPHFEKMLYDNALIIEMLTYLWQTNRDDLYAQRVEETINWLETEMMAEADDKGQHAFSAAIDADSEGEEGKFYVWQASEINAALGQHADLFKRAYGVCDEGNWEGVNILHRNHEEVLNAEEEKTLIGLKSKLLSLRNQRPRPQCDDKILADWNGLMIAALAKAAVVFDKPEWRKMAQKAFNFIVENMWQKDKFYHSFRSGQAKHEGMLEDYANMIKAALALYETTGEKAYLEYAQKWAQATEEQFVDKRGGYFQTRYGATDLIARLKSAEDNATPSGNGIMLQNFARLYVLTTKDVYRQRAEGIIAAFNGQLEHVEGFMLASFLIGAELLLDHVHVTIVAAKDGDGLFEAAHQHEHPSLIVQYLLEETGEKVLKNDMETAYVCHNNTCEEAENNAKILINTIGYK